VYSTYRENSKWSLIVIIAVIVTKVCIMSIVSTVSIATYILVCIRSIANVTRSMIKYFKKLNCISFTVQVQSG